jgi:hypothetical protein
MFTDSKTGEDLFFLLMPIHPFVSLSLEQDEHTVF